MPKRKFNPTSVDDMHLVLVHDDENYIRKTFCLKLTDCDGNELTIHLNGMQVGDIIADAREAGLPVEWKPMEGNARPKEEIKKGRCQPPALE